MYAFAIAMTSRYPRRIIGKIMNQRSRAYICRRPRAFFRKA